MAEDEKLKEDKAPPDNAGQAEGAGANPEDLMAGLLSQDNKKIGIAPWKFWLVLVLLPIVAVTSSYFLYHVGYKQGKHTLYTKDLYAVRESNRYNDPIYPVERLQVNLADADSPKYLSISLHLAIDNDTGLAECATKEGIIRDGLIGMLGIKKSWEILTPTAQNKLKRQMRDDINTNLKGTHVKEIYITEFKIMPIMAAPIFDIHNESAL